MKRFSIFSAVALTTFCVGIVVAAIFAIRYSQTPQDFQSAGSVVSTSPILTEAVSDGEAPVEESAEARAVRMAEEFVAQNGYTDLPGDKEKIAFETIEEFRDLDDLLKSRSNTLERRAYGILYRAKAGEPGWTVVFPHTKRVSDEFFKTTGRRGGKKSTSENHPIGRAVTMDADFGNLLMEHKTFPLLNVEKRF